MAEEYVHVTGLNELVRNLGKADKTLRKGITDRLRVLAREIRSAAAAKAVEEGFAKPGRSGRGTGALVRDIRYSVRGGSAFIRETALRDGRYKYPAVFEFGHSKWGHRPFLVPAIEEAQPHVLASLEAMMAEFAREFNGVHV